MLRHILHKSTAVARSLSARELKSDFIRTPEQIQHSPILYDKNTKMKKFRSFVLLGSGSSFSALQLPAFGIRSAFYTTSSKILPEAATGPVTEEQIKTWAKTALDSAYERMKLSKDLDYQRKVISPLLKAPLPLSTTRDEVDTLFFNDYPADGDWMQELDRARRYGSDVPAQQRKLLNIVQAKGSGKSLMGMQYVCKHGGLVIRLTNDDSGHIHLLHDVVNFIKQNYPACLRGQLVASYQEEEKFTEISKRAWTMVPLTFLQFAKYFFAEASLLGMSPEVSHEAYLRATLHLSSNYLSEMLVSNLSIVHDYREYWNFHEQMMVVAKAHNLTTFYYEEVHHLAQMCQSFFVKPMGKPVYGQHKALPEYEELKAERSGAAVQWMKTSLFSLHQEMMEEFVKMERLFQFCSTPVSTKNLFTSEQGSYSRSRLSVYQFCPNGSKRPVCQRFQTKVIKLFGDDAKSILERNQVKLEVLSTRAAYVNHFFKCIKMANSEIRNASLEQLIEKAIDLTFINARQLATNWVRDLLSKKENNNTWREIHDALIDVCLGKEDIVVSPSAMEILRGTGVALNRKTVDINTLLPVIWHPTPDPFIKEALQNEFLVELDLLQRADDTKEVELVGQSMTQFLLAYHAMKGNSIQQLTSCINMQLLPKLGEVYLPSEFTTIKSFVDHQIMQVKEHIDSYPKLSDFYWLTDTEPDAIVNVMSKEQNPVGFLLVSSKNHGKIINSYFFVKALQSFSYSKLTHSIKEEAKSVKLDNNLQWIRVIYGRGFTKAVRDLVNQYHSTPEGQQHPIILMTPPAFMHGGWFITKLPPNLGPLPPSKSCDDSMPFEGIKLAQLKFDLEPPAETNITFNTATKPQKKSKSKKLTK